MAYDPNVLRRAVDRLEGERHRRRVELDRLEEILNTPGRGYGIYNIEERIRIYYGAGCGVYASVTADGYTCFTVRIGKELKELSV